MQNHIDSFGGDPGNVTIFGESAGGGSVMGLLAAPSADGLYHRAIAHSPGGINLPPMVDWAAAIDPMLDGDGPLLERLRAASPEKLIQVQTMSAFSGGDIDGTVVTGHPTEAIGARPGNRVPLLIGTNHDEGTLFSAIMAEIPGAFDFVTATIATQVTRGADTAAYMEGLRAEMPEAETKAVNEAVWVDLFRRTAVESAEAATASGLGAWLYRFDLPSTVFEGALGATHAAEIAFTFNWFAADDDTGIVFHDRSDPANKQLAENWSNAVLRFARTGDPNGDGLPEWPQYDADTRPCLILDRDVRVEHDPDQARRPLWSAPTGGVSQ